jgi:hypothetical protein
MVEQTRIHTINPYSLVCPPSENMARKNASWFVHLQQTWLANNVSWFVHLEETWLGNNVSWFAHLEETWLANNVSWFAHLQETWLGNNVSWFAVECGPTVACENYHVCMVSSDSESI